MYRLIDKRITNNNKILRNNYKHLIYCIICIRRNLPTETHYCVDSAVYYADQWTKHFPLDYDAHFHLGTLLLIKAISNVNEDSIQTILNQSCEHFKKSKDIATAKHKIKSLWGLRFFIKKGNGLERLEFYDKDIDRNNLEKFYGIQKSENEVSVKIADCLIDAKFVPRRIHGLNKPDQTAQIKCYLALGISEICAYELEYV